VILWTYGESPAALVRPSADSAWAPPHCLAYWLGNAPAFDSPRNALKRIPVGRSISLRFMLWTYGESNPDLVHAMDAFYRYTIGPVIPA
jgi:hypothetical protein